MAVIKCNGLRYAFLLGLALSFFGCSSPQPDKSQVPAAKEAPKYEVYTVEIKDMKFTPDSLVVKKGDEVVFVNRDMVDHCVTETKTKAWTSGAIKAGDSYLLVARESAEYFCAIHVVMKGKIIVQ